jgi:hypothetical protein
MKIISLIITATIIATGFASCKNEPTPAQQDANDVTAYVDSVENLTPVYTAAYWTTLEEGYQLRVVKADKTDATLEIADKEKLEASKAQYAVLKSSYKVKIAESEAAIAADYRQVLRNNLFGKGIIGNDMNFSFATADNLLSIYEKFVNTVDDNKNNYSREDWDEIKVLYEALDTRKNVVEKELPKGDNFDIAKLKVKFSFIKTMHRGGTKIEENKEAKDKL